MKSVLKFIASSIAILCTSLLLMFGLIYAMTMVMNDSNAEKIMYSQDKMVTDNEPSIELIRENTNNDFSSANKIEDVPEQQAVANIPEDVVDAIGVEEAVYQNVSQDELDESSGEELASLSDDKTNEKLTIRFLNVGDGDSSLIECGGHYMLIDGGKPEKSDMIFSVLRNLNIDYLDYLIATHSDNDHYGGLLGAVQYADIGTCFAPDYNVSELDSLSNKLAEKGKSITWISGGTNKKFMLGAAFIQMIAPPQPSSDNNSSLILSVVYGNNTFLFVADAESEEEEWLLDSGFNLKADVLKVGHHGSKTSSTERFITAVSPTYGVISSSKQDEKHPSEKIMARLASRGIQLFLTQACKSGQDIVCTSDGMNIEWNVESSDVKIKGDSLKEESASKQNNASNVSNTSNAGGNTTGGRDSSKDEGYSYILNTNTGKLHPLPRVNDDEHYPMEKNAMRFKSVEEARVYADSYGIDMSYCKTKSCAKILGEY